jgi:hypothetical protein
MTPGMKLDVGHQVDVVDGGAGSPLRLEHAGCNRKAGDRRRPSQRGPASSQITQLVAQFGNDADERERERRERIDTRERERRTRRLIITLDDEPGRS